MKVFYSNISKKRIDNYSAFHHINVNKPVTYRGFLTSLTKFTKEVGNPFEKVTERMKYCLLTEISRMYIKLKSKDEWKSELKKIITKRFNQLKEKDCGKSSEFTILSKLDKEMSKYYPSIDSDFNDECNSNINSINSSIIQKNQDLIQSELDLSSENNLKYLSDIITSKTYLNEKIIDIETAHADFLKNEFFDIIHELYPKQDLIHVFSGNRTILDNQISKDAEKIKQIITDFDLTVKSYKEPKTISFADKIKSGTNYTIRETENVREIQVLVQAGHLNDIIEQDF